MDLSTRTHDACAVAQGTLPTQASIACLLARLLAACVDPAAHPSASARPKDTGRSVCECERQKFTPLKFLTAVALLLEKYSRKEDGCRAPAWPHTHGILRGTLRALF